MLEFQSLAAGVGLCDHPHQRSGDPFLGHPLPLRPQAALAPESVAVVLERLPVWLGSLGLADFKSSQSPARYRFLTTGAADFQRDVVISSVGNQVEEPQGDPTATLSCDADVLALLVWGRLKPADVLADGRLTVSAGTGPGDDFTAWLSR